MNEVRRGVGGMSSNLVNLISDTTCAPSEIFFPEKTEIQRMSI